MNPPDLADIIETECAGLEPAERAEVAAALASVARAWTAKRDRYGRLMAPALGTAAAIIRRPSTGSLEAAE